MPHVALADTARTDKQINKISSTVLWADRLFIRKRIQGKEGREILSVFGFEDWPLSLLGGNRAIRDPPQERTARDGGVDL